jgi:hypothetical protein
MAGERPNLQTVHIIRPIDNGSRVQLLCSDDRGLLSVYFDPGQFEIFLTYLYKANLELGGLLIQFDKDRVLVPQSGRFFYRLPARQKAFLA